ncbi:acyltransferase [Desulfolithobacter sp.]
MLDAASFFDLTDFSHKDLFQNAPHVWDTLKDLKTYIDDHLDEELSHPSLISGMPLTEPLIYLDGALHAAKDCHIVYGDATKGKLEVRHDGVLLKGASVIMAGAVLVGNRISIGRGVLIESGAMIKEPAIIGDETEIRQGAYLRGYCLIGDRCVVGHTTEVKHSIFLNDAKAGHFAYLGDSILGENANLGAGTKFANLRFLPGTIKIRTPDGIVDTGLRKLGAILGDSAQTGCNSATNPGTLIGRGGILMPNTTAPSGYHADKAVIRSQA